MSSRPIARSGVGNRRLQQPHQPARQRLDAAAIEQVGSIVEPQPQPLARHRHQAQRIMRGIVPADVGQAAARRPLPQGRRGRPDSSRTPPGCRTARPSPARPWISASPRCWCAISRDWLSCNSLESARSGLPGGSLMRSGSVLMNSPTMLSMPAISGGRPATVTPNTTSSRPVRRPSRIAQAAWMKVLSVRPCGARLPRQRRGQRLAQRKRDLLGRNRRPPRIVRRQPASASSSPANASRQAAMRGGAILRRDPGQIIPVRRHPRQRRRIAPLRIEREQLLHQHRHRPAVHQDVMAGRAPADAARPRAGSA